MPSKLTKFELHGYKTFASRTEFKFSDRVTAIIGPNGSGKSNIADALRWVLGEQSYSLLRGKKTVDMIFSGSESRSRAGMASASIFFDNSDNWLPIDYIEVAITRRAYRDGQNEYLLNGQRVRLRDVSELLAQSGLAERTYNVIGQGLVDTALSLRAEERRRLFEEAAGIGLYRSRREESLRRLESTQRNMERVQDILAELQPRLRSLKRQANRADEYERVKADLRIYLLDWYGYHWHQTQRDLASAKVDVREKETQLNKARTAQKELDDSITGFRDQIIFLRDQLALKQNNLSKTHDQHESVTRKIAVVNERIRSLKDAQSSAQAEKARYDEEILHVDQRIEDAESEIIQLDRELKDAEVQFDDHRSKLENSQKLFSVISEQIELTKSELTKVLTQKANLDTLSSNIRDQNIQQTKALENTIESIEKLRRELDELENRKVSTSLSIQEEIEQKKKTENALLDLQLQIKENLAEQEGLNRKINSVRAEVSKVSTKLEVLEQAENTYQGYTEGTKLLLEAIRAGRLSGGLGALSSFLTIPANIETAVASVLGEYLDAILLEDYRSVDQALDELSYHSLRGIILPIDSLNPPSKLVIDIENSPLNSDDFLGIAADLLQAPDKLKKAVDLLLGQVLIVRDRTAARKIIDYSHQRSFQNLRVVTLKGEVFHIHGPLLTGSSGQTILSRPRNRKELDQSLGTYSNQLSELEEKSTEVERQYIELKDREQSLEREFKNYLDSERVISQEIQQVELDIEKIKSNLDWQIEQHEHINSELAKKDMDLHNIQSSLLEVERLVEEKKLEIENKEQSLNELQIADQQAQYTYWNSRVAVLERGLIDLESILSDLKTTKERVIDNSKSIETRLEQYSTELHQQMSLVDKLQEDEEIIQRQMFDMKNEAQPLEDKVKSLEHDLIDLQKNDVKSRQDLSAGENNYAQARIKYSHAQDMLERLRSKIEDDFGLVEYQYTEDVNGPTPLPLEGLVEKLPVLDELPLDLNDTIQRHRNQLRRIGPINPEATQEYREVSERITFLTEQLTDLQEAESDIKEVITELDLLMEREFRNTFDDVAQEFREIFTKLFGGGAARLELTEPDDINETGIEIIARLPGRREQGLSLLSGGERSLTASALIFALLKVSPPPFCVLDEVDAMLDEANVGRFSDLLREMSQQTQFIVVTHNRGTIQVADVLYGITMGRDSTSQVISLKMEDVNEEYGV